MKKILPFFLIFGFLVKSYAQNTDLKDVNGVFLSVKKSEAAKKDVYFKEDYLPAALYSPLGKIMQNSKFKLNLQENRLFYLDNDGVTEMEVSSTLKRIEFELTDGTNVIFEKGFPSFDRFSENSYYEVLVEGKAKLLKIIKFTEVEATQYAGMPIKSIEKEIIYCGFSKNGFLKISKPENMLAICSDKSKEVQEFIQKGNLKVKKQSDLEQIVNYYNGLF